MSTLKTQAWTLRAEVAGFHLLHGTHAGANLGRYFIGLCDRVGIMSPKHQRYAFTYYFHNQCHLNLIVARCCDSRQHIVKQHILRGG
jgi:hypothetical protein